MLSVASNLKHRLFIYPNLHTSVIPFKADILFFFCKYKMNCRRYPSPWLCHTKKTPTATLVSNPERHSLAMLRGATLFQYKAENYEIIRGW